MTLANWARAGTWNTMGFAHTCARSKMLKKGKGGREGCRLRRALKGEGVTKCSRKTKPLKTKRKARRGREINRLKKDLRAEKQFGSSPKA